MSSTLRVNTITNITGDGAVDFPKGITGDGSNLNFDPKIIGNNPTFFATGKYQLKQILQLPSIRI